MIGCVAFIFGAKQEMCSKQNCGCEDWVQTLLVLVTRRTSWGGEPRMRETKVMAGSSSGTGDYGGLEAVAV